jgi:membrane protein
MKTIRRFFSPFVEAYKHWLDDRASNMAAALAYYSLFSAVSLIAILVGLATFALREVLRTGRLAEQVQRALTFLDEILGEALAEMILTSTIGVFERGPFTAGSLASLVIILWGASNVFQQLDITLNVIWGVPPKPGRGLMRFIRGRLLAFAVLAVSALLLVLFLVLSMILAIFLPTLTNRIGLNIAVLTNISLWQLGIALLLTMLLFALLYKYFPVVSLAWRDVFPGAAVAAVLFMLASIVLNVYFRVFPVRSLQGVAGSIAALLIWSHFSAQIFLYGAEFTRVFALRYGSHRELKGSYRRSDQRMPM